jgi:hypothetical protein
MNRQLLTRLTQVLGALVVLWALFALLRVIRQDRPRGLALPAVDTASVDTVSLVRGADSIILARQAGVWRVNGFPASPDAISALLAGLADSATSTELVAESESSHLRLGVSADSGRRLRVVSGSRTVLDVITGNRMSGGFNAGVLIRRDGDNDVYSLRGSLANALDRDADGWRDRRIVVLEPDSLGLIEVRRGPRGFTLRRADSVWTFAAGGARADSAAVANLLYSYRAITASAFATKAQEDSINFARGRGRLRLATRAGTQLANLVFDSTASGVWVRNDSGGAVYRIDTWTWNSIAPAESTLRVRR